MANESFVALGKIAMKPRGPWTEGISYKELDIVTYKNSSYIATKGTDSTNSNYPGAPDAPWMLLNDISNVARELYGALYNSEFYKQLTLINGNTNSKGVINRAQVHRITSEQILTFDHAVMVTCQNANYLVGYHIFDDNGTHVSWNTWAKTATLQPGVHYRLMFRVNPDDESATLDIDEFMSEVTFTLPSAINTLTSAINTLVPTSHIVSIGHGGTKVWPPNTLGLYKQYYKNNIMNWECDVKVTNINGSQHDYVLCHDDDIYTHALKADGTEIEQNTILISNSTLDTLRTYKFGCLAGSGSAPSGLVEGFENETIPTLQEFLLLAKAAGATVFIEPKFSLNDTKYTGQVTNIVNIIKRYGMLDNAYIIAYAVANKVIEEAAGAGAQNFCIIINNGEASAAAIQTAVDYLEGKTVKNVFFNPSSGNLINAIDNNIDIIGIAASHGMKVSTWTIQENTSTANIIKLYEAGCTAFITNRDNIEKIIRKSYGLTLD